MFSSHMWSWRTHKANANKRTSCPAVWKRVCTFCVALILVFTFQRVPFEGCSILKISDPFKLKEDPDKESSTAGAMTSLLLFRYVRMQNVCLCVRMCVRVCECVLLQHLHFPRQINKTTGIRLALRYSCVFPDNKSIEHTHAQLGLHTVSQSHTHTHIRE